MKEAVVPASLYDEEYYKESGGSGGFKIIKESKGMIFPGYYEERFKRAEIKPGMRVLDVGCGRGEFVLWCAIQGAKAVGIDYSAEAIAVANELKTSLDREDNRFKANATFICSEAKPLPFADASFDRIFSFAVLEHLHDWEIQELLGECRRLLKRDGMIYMETHPNLWYVKYIFPFVAFVKNHLLIRNKNAEPAKYDSGGLHVNEQSVVSLYRNLKRAGFRGKILIAPRNHLNRKVFNEKYGVFGGVFFTIALLLDRCPPFNLFFGLIVCTKASPENE